MKAYKLIALLEELPPMIEILVLDSPDGIEWEPREPNTEPSSDEKVYL